jgi:hypothetical protein
MDIAFDINNRPQAMQFIVATLAGSVVGTAVLLAYVLQFDGPDWNTMCVALHAETLAQALAATYLVVVAGGVLPTLFIGFALIAFKNNSPLMLVLAPATLFILILGEMAREMNDLYLPLLLFPAIMAGGATMLWLLARRVQKTEPLKIASG